MYNPIIVEHFTNPRNIGEIANPDQEINIGNPVCGDTIVMHLKLSQTDQKVEDAKFKAYGCATSIATASIFSEFIIDKTFDEINLINTESRKEMLGELEPSQMHCLEILNQLFAHFLKVIV